MKSNPPSDRKDPAQRPNATSPGNEGARGSRGQANSGAQPANSTNAGGRAPEPSTDLRKDDAQGGGGVASESTRSK
jgi:hypothetical protein